MLFWIIFAVCVALTVFFTIKRTEKVKYSDLVVKIFTSALFVATSIAAIISNPQIDLVFALMVVMGGVFGVLGDVFIELKWLQKEGNDTFFNLGFITFMIQHVILVAAVFIKYPMSLVNALICFSAPVVVLIASVGLTKLFRMEMGKFKTIANAYGALASMTFSVGFMTMIKYGMETSMILFFAGGISFFASDLILSQIFFVKGKCTRLRVILNHITYYGAQILIASSLFFMK